MSEYALCVVCGAPVAEGRLSLLGWAASVLKEPHCPLPLQCGSVLKHLHCPLLPAVWQSSFSMC